MSTSSSSLAESFTAGIYLNVALSFFLLVERIVKYISKCLYKSRKSYHIDSCCGLCSGFALENDPSLTVSSPRVVEKEIEVEEKEEVTKE